MRNVFRASVLSGLTLFGTGVGMRAYANLDIAQTTNRLVSAVPQPAEIVDLPTRLVPASGLPTLIRLPDYDLWNTLEIVPRMYAPMARVWQVSDAGWYAESSLPGWGGNVVVAGHSPSSDMTVWEHSVFRQLAYLSPGDPIELTAGERVYRYQVTRVFALSEAEANAPESAVWAGYGPGERLTLITCYPPHTGAYRVVVIAHGVQTDD